MAATRTALAPVPTTRSSAALRVARPVEADAPTRPDLRVVPPRRPVGAVVVAALVVVFAILLATAALNTVLVSGQRDLDRIETQIQEGEQRNQALALEVAELESPERIVEAAEDQGMVVPEDPIWLTPRPDGGTDATTAGAGGDDVRATDDTTDTDDTSDTGAADDTSDTGDDPTGDGGDEVAAGGSGGSGG